MLREKNKVVQFQIVNIYKAESSFHFSLAQINKTKRKKSVKGNQPKEQCFLKFSFFIVLHSSSEFGVL